MKSKSTSSFSGLNVSRRLSKLGDMLAQKKMDEARRFIHEKRMLVAVELSDAAVVPHHAGCKKR